MTDPQGVTVHFVLRNRNPLPLAELSKGLIRMSIAEFSEKYGADPAALDGFVKFVEEKGLTVVDQNQAWRTVSLQGSAESILGLFPLPPKIAQVVEGVFDLPLPPSTVDTAATAAQPKPTGYGVLKASVPAALQAAAAFERRGGTPSSPVPRSVAPDSRGGTPSPPLPPVPIVPSYTPPQFADFYDFPANLGKGECVGVLELGGGYQASDMETFFDTLGIEMPKIIDVGPNKWATDPSVFWINFEVTMDVQIVASCVPEATTVVYFAGAQTDAEITAWTFYKLFCMSLFDEVNTPSVLTLSGGLPENLTLFWTLQEAQMINNLLPSASALGVTVCLPSGDSGSIYPAYSGMFAAPTIPYFPGSSPWVLCCGGTTLNIVELGLVQEEKVWNRLANHMWNLYLIGETYYPGPPPVNNPPPSLYPKFSIVPSNLGAGSGGVSWYFDLPWFQEQAAVPVFQVWNFVNWAFEGQQTIRGRGVPDIAANADFLTGYRVFIDGQWRNGGGTSASTPLMASLMARCNQALGQSLGYITPVLYSLKLDSGVEIFNEIAGNNGGYEAHKGDYWNPCVGLGSPKGKALLEALRSFFQAEYATKP